MAALGACSESATASFDGGLDRDEAAANGQVGAESTNSQPGATVTDIPIPPNVPDIDTGDVGVSGGTADTGPLPNESAKFDEVYLVPPGVASRGQVAASEGRVAWVERTTTQETPNLVVWEVFGTGEPVVLRTPNLVNPTQLVLSEGWLVYVDDRYGDPDLFAVNLETGLEEAIATEIGAQVEPDIQGDLVAWRDCRGCVDGGDSAAEIYSIDLASGAPAKRITVSETDDRGPSFGRLADGTEVLAWIEGERRLRVQGLDVEATWEVGAFVSSVDVAAGLMTWREATGIINPDSMKPLIINPDSMMPAGIINPDSMIPSDVYGTQVSTGETHAISVHAELSPESLGSVHAAGVNVAWVEANTEMGVGSRVQLANAATGKVSETIDVPGLWSPALAADLVVFIAPRDDNAGLDDVWVLPLEPTIP
jgi:hypothetical protein